MCVARREGSSALGKGGGTFKLLFATQKVSSRFSSSLRLCAALVGVIRVEEGEVGESIDRVQPSSQPKSCKTQPIAQRE